MIEEKHIRQEIYNFFEDVFNRDIDLKCDLVFQLRLNERLTKELTERIMNLLGD